MLLYSVRKYNYRVHQKDFNCDIMLSKGEDVMENRADCQSEIQFIGLRIAYFRKLRNMTQSKLAQEVHINKNYLSHIESGSEDKAVSLPLLIRIARALKVELSVLVDLSDLEHSKESEIKGEFEEMRIVFQEMKQLNYELDKMMLEMDNVATGFKKE